jgi:anti-sigma-K factor RskA
MEQFCPEHIKTAEALARIEVKVNGSYDRMASHVEDSKGWRTAIVSVAIAVILNVVSFAYIYGKLSNTVERNTLVINKMLSDNIEIAKEVKRNTYTP